MQAPAKDLLTRGECSTVEAADCKISAYMSVRQGKKRERDGQIGVVLPFLPAI